MNKGRTISALIGIAAAMIAFTSVVIQIDDHRIEKDKSGISTPFSGLSIKALNRNKHKVAVESILLAY